MIEALLAAEIPNWLAAIPVLLVTVIKLIWAMDLVSTSALAAGVRAAITDGALWLGLALGALGIYLSGAIGFVLLADPRGTAPAWWALGMIAASVFMVLAWYLLTFQEAKDDE